MNEYRTNYPDDVVQRSIFSKEERIEQGRRHSEWFANEENYARYAKHRSYPSELKHWLDKGFTDDEAQQKVVEFQRKASSCATVKTREAQSAASSGTNNPMSLHSIADRHSVSLDEAKMLTPGYGRVGKKHPMFGKKHTFDALVKIAMNTPQTFRNRSKGEIELGTAIMQHYDESLHAKLNLGIKRYNCDIVFDDIKVIVEYFGDAWHMNPALHGPCAQQFRTKQTAAQKWVQDTKKINALKQLGYDVIIVWESDWKNNPKRELQKIYDIIDTKKDSRKND